MCAVIDARGKVTDPDLNARPNVGFGSRLCEDSDVELARRNFVSITLNRKKNGSGSRGRRGDKGENNSAHSLRAHVFTRPGSFSEVGPRSRDVRFAPVS